MGNSIKDLISIRSSPMYHKRVIDNFMISNQVFFTYLSCVFYLVVEFLSHFVTHVLFMIWSTFMLKDRKESCSYNTSFFQRWLHFNSLSLNLLLVLLKVYFLNFQSLNRDKAFGWGFCDAGSGCLSRLVTLLKREAITSPVWMRNDNLFFGVAVQFPPSIADELL